MSPVTRFTARIPLRGPSGPDGRLSDPIEFVEIDGKCYELPWIKSIENLALRRDQLVEEPHVARPITPDDLADARDCRCGFE